MKSLFKIILLLLLALAVAGLGLFNNGSMLLISRGYQFEISLNLFIILWFLSFILVYYVIRLYINIKRLPTKIQRSRAKNALIASRKHLNLAGLHYFEGKYRQCYENSLKSIKREYSSENKFLAYLLAFRATSIMRDSAKEQDILIQLNSFSDSKWQLAKHMVIAENLYNEQKYGQCLDNLNAVLNLDHKHIPARRIMLKVYLNLSNYTKSYEILEWLLKNDSLREYKAGKYKLSVISGLFNQVSSVNELNKYYTKLEHQEQVNFIYVKLYTNALIRLSEYNLVIEFLDKIQNNMSLMLIHPETILVLSKKNLDNLQIERLIKIAESVLISEKENQKILLAIGILYYKKGNLVKSQSFLEASSNLKESLDGCHYLILIAQQNNDSKLLEIYQKKLLNTLNNNI